MNTTTLRVLAMIPARGGSKGLPGKNLRHLGGLPLIAHPILMARMCPEITRAIVSTDSDQIAVAAKEHGGDVPFMRPPELAKDDTPMWPVIRHALQAVEQQEGRLYDEVLLIDPTSPARLPEDIAGAFKLLRSKPDADGVLGVSQPEFNPLWNSWIEKEGWLTAVFEDSAKYACRQQVSTVYRINASLYIWRAAYVREKVDTWRGGRMLGYEIPDYRAIHIDDVHEFNRAEILLKAGYIMLPWLKQETASR
jgi:N-acylneuraminate cytidylyltransferase